MQTQPFTQAALILCLDPPALTPPRSLLFHTMFGCTDLRMNLSGAKFAEEADFDVHSVIGSPKRHQIDENLTFRSENFTTKFFPASKNRNLQILSLIHI